MKVIKTSSLLIIFILLSNYLLAQEFNINTDTSKLKKSEFKKPEKLTRFVDFIFEKHSINPNNSLQLIDFAITRTIENKDLEMQAKAINVKGVIYNSQSNYSSALKYYINALKIFEKGSNYYSTAMTTNNVGKVFLGLGKLNDAKNYLKQAENLGLKHQINPVLVIVFSNLCNLNIAAGNLNQALEYALKSDNLNDKVGNKTVQNINANNVGALYFYKSDFDNALKYYLKAQKLSEDSGDLTTFFRAEWNIGEVYENTKKADALPYYQRALAHFISIKDDEAVGGIYTYISNYYVAKGDVKQAFEYYKKAVAANEKNTNLLARKNLSQLQTQYETEKKELKIGLLSKSDSIKTLTINKNLFMLTQQNLALSNAHLRIKNDSLMLFKQKQNMYASKLDSIKKVQHIEKLTKASLLSKLEISRKNVYLIIIASFAILSIITAYAIYRRRILKQQNFMIAEQAKQREVITKAIIDAEEKERKRIGSDLHDGVGQLFSAVKMNLSGLFDRITFENSNEKFLAEKTLSLVEESCKEVRIISHKMMPNTLLKSGIASDIKSFIEKLDEQNLKVNFSAKGFNDQLEHNEEVILYKVIQELVGNIIKHAKATELTISLENNKKFINAFVKDNGVGFNVASIESFAGIGLKNIQTRIQYLNGIIHFDSSPNKGTAVNISVPIS